ncbi:BamA/TamA family outer membrane protein [uncultured Mucilaginibacter sp.]|uniref:translocation and assembly module lipoprotein TamL n=1 Tax=uncultured Mucilaginibacter sp. TaxID=797541 RepID=UPI0025D17525|nr:BamA/TamA family outer membrane protein [uncultured Mucilaginibacter sp.]
MKPFYPENKLYSLAILSILLVFTISGCSLTRGLKDNEYLVRKITVDSVDQEFSDASLLYVDRLQQPNSWFNLQLYYLFNKKGNKDIGEPPAILDSALIEFSRLQIEKFLRNKGYLKASVASAIKTQKKKAFITFTAKQGPMFRIRNVQDSIPDPNVQVLYRINRRRFSHVQPGGRFDTDSLAYDRDAFYQIMKQNGYYDFYRQYMNYNYDSTFNSSVVDIKVLIDNPAGKKNHPIYKINNTLITIATSTGRTTGNADTLRVDSQFTFVDYSRRFKPNAVLRYVFQHKGDIYNIDQQTLTTSRLSELNVFRNVPNPIYTKTPDSVNHLLNSRIDIIPLKRMSDRIEAEYLHSGPAFFDFWSGSGYGFNIGNTFSNRNLFKQAEILQIKLNYSVLFAGNTTTLPGAIQNQDFKIGANLVYPRIISPFNLPSLGKYGVPHTTFASSFQLFYQNGLVKRRSFINSLTYDWMETSRKQHSLTPISIEFSNGTIDPTARDILLSQNRYSYVYLIGRTVFTASTQYTYQLNFNKLNSLANFVYFRGTIDLGGNTLALISRVLNTRRDSLGQRTLFGHAFAQYAKADVDLRFYRNLGGNEQQFVFRFNPGLGLPFGNSNQLIFERNFYAGGANDIRAWLPRTLGPGNFNRAIYKDNNIRDRLKYLDQFGEIKIIGNMEYRYKIANDFFGTKLKGATFIDFGNVWRLDETVENPGGQFKFNNLFNSTAVGIGTGLRFDLTFFVFRLDAAFKFKDPQFTGADQYVLIKHFSNLFKQGDFKKTYKATNNEDYRFMQLNFGIGLPF